LRGKKEREREGGIDKMKERNSDLNEMSKI